MVNFNEVGIMSGQVNVIWINRIDTFLAKAKKQWEEILMMMMRQMSSMC